MSQQNSSDPKNQFVQKQSLNVYTVMLIVAFCAITIANLLLYLELRRWGSFPWWKAESGGGATTSFIHSTDDFSSPAPCLKDTSVRMWS